MKNIFYLSAILVLQLFACKKDKIDLPIGTIKVDIGGVANTFSVSAKTTRLQVTGGFGIQMQGNLKTTSTTNLSFSIVSPNPILNGTYTENTASNPLVTMTHCIEVLVPCVLQFKEHGSSSNPVSITITEITASSVKGNFKGELSGNSTEVLTNGVFYVSF